MTNGNLPLSPPAAAAITRRLSRVRLAYVGAFVILVAIGFAIGGSAATVVATSSGVLGVAGVWYGVAVLRPPRAGAWATLAVGVGTAAIAEICLGYPTPVGAEYSSVANVLFTVAYVPLAVAILWIGHPPSVRLHLPAVLDAAVLSLAGSLIAWFTLFRPALINLDLSGLARMVAIFDWVGDVALMAVTILMLLTWRANRAVHLLGVAIGALLIAEVLNGMAMARDDVAGGRAIYLAFSGFCLFCGLAAMNPAAARLTGDIARPERLSGGRLVLLALALLVPPSILLAEATRGPVDVFDAIAIISAVVALLLLARIVNAVRTIREHANQEIALRNGTSALSVASNADQVQHDLRNAVRAMIGAGASTATLHPPDGALTVPVIGLLDRGRRSRVRLPISPTTTGSCDSIGEVRIEGPTRRVPEFIEQLGALADQTGAALARISLGEAVREHERESYFRTLVRNSSDVILITRAGVVEYATPSADQLFSSRNIVGERFDGLVTVGDHRLAADVVDGTVDSADGERIVKVQRRDLSSDPSVRGVVVTLHDITAQRRLQDELTHRATHDPLTGLANGELLREQLRKAEHATSSDRCSAMLFADLDNFKEVNDSLGHAAGDELLKATAERLSSCLRRDHDMAARLGGDEFAILLRSLHTIAAAREVASRVVNAFRRPIHVQDVAVNCTVSVGLASAVKPDEYDSLLRRADVAVYAAKAAGRDRWAENPSTAPATYHGADQRQDPAIALHYQPIVDLATGKALGFEALTRLNSPQRLTMSPADYIAQAENDGLIVAIGDWVIDEALRDAIKLNEVGSRYVSVNVSPVQLRQPGFADRVLERLSSSPVSASHLMVELTERLQLDAASSAWQELDKLHDAGVRVALDDYGTMYASLSYLRHRCVDVIKLDRSFLRDIRQRRAQALVEVVVELCRELDIDLIVEGVENASVRDAAVAAGCQHGQGLYFAPALPLDVAAQWSQGHARIARVT